MRRQWSPVEVLLIVVVLVLTICCIGLIVVSWISLQPEGAIEPVLSGKMTITGGAVFSEDLRNSSSLQFKSLAFDIQNVVSKAFSGGELRHGFRSCQVLSFSQGSVVVTFDLWFYLLVTVKQVKQELEAGLQQIDTGGLIIDRSSIQITGHFTHNMKFSESGGHRPNGQDPKTSSLSRDGQMVGQPCTDAIRSCGNSFVHERVHAHKHSVTMVRVTGAQATEVHGCCGPPAWSSSDPHRCEASMHSHYEHITQPHRGSKRPAASGRLACGTPKDIMSCGL
ncbi:enteropeptidase-like [Thalassophryne amazonica]|uniref:enteropeptidase-like n=1 Tax=Thalassophryne amazonica TaxID=390379 RepID=UPI0014713AC9|nr:enteropeptidase-like [Thalassophryne amazonica]